MIKDYFLIIWRNFTRRKVRSWLTIIGVLIGITAVVALISVAQGLENAITEQFEMMGTDKLMVTPGGGSGMGSMYGAFSPTVLTNGDIDTIKKSRGIDVVGGMYYKTGKVKFRDETKYTFVIGMPTDESAKIIEDMQGFGADKGRMVEKGDEGSVSVGWLLWGGDFFKQKINIGDKLFIEDKEFKVVGLISKVGNRGDDSQIYITLDSAWDIYGVDDEYSMLWAQVKEGFTPEEVAENVKKDLREARDEEKGEEGFSVQTFEQLLQQVGTILSVVSAVLITIAAISLLVGGVGIMNSMYTSVLERTREIGIMKAVGAKNSHIMILFLIESGTLGLVGGIIGVIFGIAISKGVEAIAVASGIEILKIAITPQLVLGALFFSFVVGALSGALPARTASKLRPVDALRYE